MIGINWFAVHIDCTGILNINYVAASTFDALLCFVVMERTQGLQWTMPEQFVVERTVAAYDRQRLMHAACNGSCIVLRAIKAG